MRRQQAAETPRPPIPPATAEAIAECDDLRYSSDSEAGIKRRRAGTGFTYVGADGKRVTDEATLQRIRKLAVPPAYRDVWICRDARGHIQATGRDERGRKQYRYHPRWREVRDANKYDRLAEFGERLPDLRTRLDEDLTRSGLPERKVIAAVVQLLDQTLIRVGNDEYAASNESFGLTTIGSEHVDVDGSKIHFEFPGKGGVEHAVSLRDQRLASIVIACQDLPGEDLFAYVEGDGTAVDVTSTMVNHYLRDLCDANVTAKDFRTWGGTVIAADVLAPLPVPDNDGDAKSNELAAIDAAADRLRNTRTVCRNCYV